MALSRGRFPARLTMPDIEPALLERYRLLWRAEDLYHNPELFPLLSAHTLFGSAAPLVIDVGCATGEFICGLAAERPEHYFLGVEMSRKPIEHAVARAIALGLENIRFVQTDMTLAAQRLAPDSVGMLCIHFPVPFTTTHKRRHLTYGQRMLEIYQHALIPGGRLSIVTDDMRVAEDVQRTIAAFPGFRIVPEAAWQIALGDHLKSPYQRLWEKRKRTIWRAEYAKRGSGIRGQSLGTGSHSDTLNT